MRLRRNSFLSVAAAAAVLVAAGRFAAFESHVQKYDAFCFTSVDPNNEFGRCLSIHLSESFIAQTKFLDVTYKIYCEDKEVEDPDYADGNITPYIIIQDSDTGDGNDFLDNPNGDGGCGEFAYGPGPSLNPVQWAHGELVKVVDQVDLWDMSFYAPLCEDNWNSETDPLDPTSNPGGGLVPKGECHKGPGPDSDEFVDLASNVKFQITGFSVP